MVYNGGHRIVHRPAYYSVNGPIEYIINIYEQELKQSCYAIKNGNQIIQKTNGIVANISARTTINTFYHCGYQ